MSERGPLDWALVAVEAATIKTFEVRAATNPTDSTLPALEIGNTVLWLRHYQVVRGEGEVRWGWCTGDFIYDTLAEALAEAISQEVYNQVEEALGTAGLAT